MYIVNCTLNNGLKYSTLLEKSEDKLHNMDYINIQCTIVVRW